MTKEQEIYNAVCCKSFSEAMNKICEETDASFEWASDFENENHIIATLELCVAEEGITFKFYFCPLEVLFRMEKDEEESGWDFQTTMALQDLECMAKGKQLIIQKGNEILFDLQLDYNESCDSIITFIKSVAKNFTGEFIENTDEETGEVSVHNNFLSPADDVSETLEANGLSSENIFSLLQIDPENLTVDYKSRTFSMLPYILQFGSPQIFDSILKLGAIQDVSEIKCYLFSNKAKLLNNLGSSIGKAFKKNPFSILDSLVEVGVAAGKKLLGSVSASITDDNSILILTDVNVIIANKNHAETFGLDELDMALEMQRDETISGAVDIYLHGELFIDNAAEQDWSKFCTLARTARKELYQPKAMMIENHAEQASAQADDDPMEVLAKLKKMLEAGLIEQSDFDEKKKEVLSRL